MKIADCRDDDWRGGMPRSRNEWLWAASGSKDTELGVKMEP